MPKVKDEAGKKYGRLTVVGYRGISRLHHARWECMCDCGTRVIVNGSCLRSGHTTSCGCVQKERTSKARKSHGMSMASVYSVWAGMISRCENKNNKSFKDYGGRGIAVCREWHISGSFCKWALENGYEKGLEIDRIDNDSGYSPKNCRFTTSSNNSVNKRPKANKQGYTGVCLLPSGNFIAYITYKTHESGERVHLGTFYTKKAALEARNKYIKDNRLPHKIQEYQGENPKEM